MLQSQPIIGTPSDEAHPNIVILSIVIMFEFFYNFLGLNHKLFFIINKATNIGILAEILQFVSWFFSISKFAVYYILFCIYFYIKLKRIVDLNQRQSRFWALYNNMTLIGVTYTIFGLIYSILKFSINLPRPFCSLRNEEFFTIINTNLERCLSSFPSAHTGLALLVLYFLWQYLNIIQKIIGLLIILLVAISRITLAMHYPSDIIYSFLTVTIVIVIGKTIYTIFAKNIIHKIGTIIYTKFI